MTKRRRIRQAREQLARLAAPWIYEQAKNPRPRPLYGIGGMPWSVRLSRHDHVWSSTTDGGKA